MFPKVIEGLERCGANRQGSGHSSQRVTDPDPLLPLEAFLIPAPYYGAITQHVYLYGNIRLVYVYLDSEVSLPGTPCRTLAFQPAKTSLRINLRLDVGGCPRQGLRLKGFCYPWPKPAFSRGSQTPSTETSGVNIEAKGSPGETTPE